MNILDQLLPEAGAYYVMDRGYLDFGRLYRLTLAAAFFVTRTKENVHLQRRYSHSVPPGTGVKSDQTVVLITPGSTPKALSGGDAGESRYFDADHQRFLVFLTNNFELPALIIANLYKEQVRLAGRTILQVDQAAPANQGLLWHQSKCGTKPNLDCDFRLRPGRHHQEGTPTVRQSLPNSTGRQRHDFRASAHSTGTSAAK